MKIVSRTFAILSLSVLCVRASASNWDHLLFHDAKGKPVKGATVTSWAMQKGTGKRLLEFKDRTDGELEILGEAPREAPVLNFGEVGKDGRSNRVSRAPAQKGPAWGKTRNWWRDKIGYIEFDVPRPGKTLFIQDMTDFDRWYPLVANSVRPPKGQKAAGRSRGELYSFVLLGMDGKPVTRAQVTALHSPENDLGGEGSVVIGRASVRGGKAVMKIARPRKGWTTVIYIHDTPGNRPVVFQTDPTAETFSGHLAVMGRSPLDAAVGKNHG